MSEHISSSFDNEIIDPSPKPVSKNSILSREQESKDSEIMPNSSAQKRPPSENNSKVDNEEKKSPEKASEDAKDSKDPNRPPKSQKAFPFDEKSASNPRKSASKEASKIDKKSKFEEEEVEKEAEEEKRQPFSSPLPCLFDSIPPSDPLHPLMVEITKSLTQSLPPVTYRPLTRKELESIQLKQTYKVDNVVYIDDPYYSIQKLIGGIERAHNQIKREVEEIKKARRPSKEVKTIIAGEPLKYRGSGPSSGARSPQRASIVEFVKTIPSRDRSPELEVRTIEEKETLVIPTINISAVNKDSNNDIQEKVVLKSSHHQENIQKSQATSIQELPVPKELPKSHTREHLSGTSFQGGIFETFGDLNATKVSEAPIAQASTLAPKQAGITAINDRRSIPKESWLQKGASKPGSFGHLNSPNTPIQYLSSSRISSSTNGAPSLEYQLLNDDYRDTLQYSQSPGMTRVSDFGGRLSSNPFFQSYNYLGGPHQDSQNRLSSYGAGGQSFRYSQDPFFRESNLPPLSQIPHPHQTPPQLPQPSPLSSLINSSSTPPSQSVHPWLTPSFTSNNDRFSSNPFYRGTNSFQTAK